MSNERHDRIVRIMRARNVTYLAAARAVDAEDLWGRWPAVRKVQA